ncbi:hypothetical protein O4G98_15900 [Zoogloeaceae bacterium G21618-S1]|nr:hypothetical protein [Zoogloeaceae bacterium G21618-S1]
MMYPTCHRLAAIIGLSAALALPAPVMADPPGHAPAHGWRKKHDPNYVGYTGRKWARDYGILDGHCSTEAVGAVVGGVIGGAIGSTVGQGDGRRIAVVLGTVIGSIVGAGAARDLGDLDRACLGHALELSGDRHRVSWRNPDTGIDYLLSPVRSVKRDGLVCREFDLTAAGKKHRRLACAEGNGRWQMR